VDGLDYERAGGRRRRKIKAVRAFLRGKKGEAWRARRGSRLQVGVGCVVGLLLLGEEEEEAAAREEEAERAQLRFEVEFRFLCGVDSLDRSGEDGPTYFLFFFFCLWEDGAAQF